MALAKPAWPVLQRGDPLSIGLQLAWPLYEGSGGAVNDVTGIARQNPGASSGTNGGFNGTWAGGVYGWVAHTDGSTTQITLGKTGLAPPFSGPQVQTGDFSVAVGFKVSTLGSYTPIFDCVDTNSLTTRLISLFLKAGGGASSVFWAVGGNAGTDSISIGTSLAANTHYDLVVTRKGSLSSFYINGSLGGTTSAQTATAAGQGLYISLGGNPSTGGTKEPTDYDYFVLWNRALDAGDVARFCSDPFYIDRPKRRVSWFTIADGTTTPSSLEFAWDPQYPMRSRPRMFGAMLQDDAMWPNTAVATPSQYGWVAPETVPHRARFFRGKVDETALANLATPTPTQQGFAWEPQFPTRRKPQVLQPDQPQQQWPFTAVPTPGQFGWYADFFLPIRRKFWKNIAGNDEGPWKEPPASPVTTINRIVYGLVSRVGRLMGR